MGRRSDGITIRQLQTFVAAAKAGSFVRAAEELGISQPAVSERISQLEFQLGYPLFQRRLGATSLLSDEGHDLLTQAEALLQSSNMIFGRPSKYRSLIQLPVNLCIGARLRDEYLKNILPKIYLEHPEIKINMTVIYPVHEVQAALDRGKVDLVVYTIGYPINSWPNFRKIKDIPMSMVACPEMAVNIQAGKVALEDCNFFLPTTAHFGENWTERLLKEAGIFPKKPPVYIEFADVIQRLVEEGHGITVLMHEQLDASIASGRLKIVGPPISPMHRVMARSTTAPDSAVILENALLEALND